MTDADNVTKNINIKQKYDGDLEICMVLAQLSAIEYQNSCIFISAF
jgi:hypothetical protein